MFHPLMGGSLATLATMLF